MSRLKKSELRPLVKSTLEMHGHDPAAYNITGIIRDIWGDEPYDPMYGYSGAQSEEEFFRAMKANARPGRRAVKEETHTTDPGAGNQYTEGWRAGYDAGYADGENEGMEQQPQWIDQGYELGYEEGAHDKEMEYRRANEDYLLVLMRWHESNHSGAYDTCYEQPCRFAHDPLAPC